MEHSLSIRMLGSFVIEKSGHLLSDHSNHSRKMWMLLAYLFYFHEKKIPQNELISAVWENEDNVPNPTNVLKVLLHRTRNMLSEWDSNLGKSLILCTNGEYYINPDISITLDVTDFEILIQEAKTATDLNKKLAFYQKAFSLYQGDFLENFATEVWIVPLCAYYHKLYLEMVEELIQLYKEQLNDAALISLCRKVCSKEKYEETLHLHLMNAFLRTEQYEEAIHVYQSFQKALSLEFGILPSSKMQTLFRKARQGLYSDLVEADALPKLMLENAGQRGALFCEIDIFKQIYQFTARGMERTGNVIHIVLINITDIHNHLLTKRSLSTVVKNLREFLCTKLRSGDIISMCSPSQFILLLPNANFEDTQKVMNRLETGFYKQYPHTPAKLVHHIQPIVLEDKK